MVSALNCYSPIKGGISFLQYEPDTILCFQNATWQNCTKEEICENEFPYKGPDNWVSKFDMLCEPKEKIGMLGSAFFLGILLGLAFVPKLSDIYGRKPLFLLTMVVSGFAQIGLILAQKMETAIFLMMVLGTTFPGKNVVGLNYFIEFLEEKHQQMAITCSFLAEGITLGLLCLFYQFVNPGWFIP